ncbi:MAG: hypothetical protein HRU41_32060 [Saprospiraceae bacterium]|nr:hypothetical protein [Saprospiraceae bacterium]
MISDLPVVRRALLDTLFSSVLSVLLFTGLLGCGAPTQTEEQEDKPEHPGTFLTIEKQFSNSQVDGYNLYIPRTCTASSAPFPLIVFLQGGFGIGGKVEAIFKWELPKELKENHSLDTELNQLKLNTFVYVMPHITSGEYYHGTAGIQQIIDEVLAQYNVDEKRIYLTGLSRGGFGTWGIASQIPERFAAIAPIAGNTLGVSSFEALQDLPIWTAHNLEDERVDYARTENAVRKLERLSEKKFHRTSTVAEAAYLQHDRIFTSGANPSFEHDAWTEMYNEVNFFKWLLKYKIREGE